ncbi:MAG: hypothetical protein NVS1B11_34100 [Terriglobales bacterium]
MEFQRAEIKVENEKEFEELKAAINRAFGSDKVEKFLQHIQSGGIRVRNFEAVLARAFSSEAARNRAVRTIKACTGLCPCRISRRCVSFIYPSWKN